MAAPSDKKPSGGGALDLGTDEGPRRGAGPTARASAPPGGAASPGPAKPAPKASAPSTKSPPASVVPASPFKMTQHQKQSLQSGFQDGARGRKLASVVGQNPAGSVARPQPTSVLPPVTTQFDGTSAPPELQGRDVWKAVQPPVMSAPGQRSPAVSDQVIKQFAVGTNQRYEPDSPDKPRSHIFVWDVSRAMGCEIPHFTGAKELSLAQTCDWVRHEGAMRGWLRVAEHELFALLETGQLVVVLPREIRHRWIAIAPPQPPTSDRKPLVTGACRQRGHLLHVTDMLGVRLVEYFTHP